MSDEREKPRSSDGFELDFGLPEASLGARETARITRVAPSTFNVWISRGLFPGVTIGPHGQARAFSANLIFHLYVVADLVRLGFAAPTASITVIQAHSGPEPLGPGRWLVIGPVELGSPASRPVYVIKDRAEIDRVLPGGGYTAVNVGDIYDRVLAAVAEAAAKPAADPEKAPT